MRHLSTTFYGLYFSHHIMHNYQLQIHGDLVCSFHAFLHLCLTSGCSSCCSSCSLWYPSLMQTYPVVISVFLFVLGCTISVTIPVYTETQSNKPLMYRSLDCFANLIHYITPSLYQGSTLSLSNSLYSLLNFSYCMKSDVKSQHLSKVRGPKISASDY